jgi:hypothetical protein
LIKEGPRVWFQNITRLILKKRVEAEIKRLRELVGELRLEFRFKEELLKKANTKTGCLMVID